MKKKILTVSLVIIQLLQISASAAAYDKDEVVYVTLGSGGDRERMIVVNSIKTNGSESVTDYGNYDNIKNLSSADNPKISGNALTWNTKGMDTFYYQGEVKNGELPWDFTVRYILDGREITGEELIGQSGHVSLVIDAELNKKANSYYTDNYMAQISFTLDSDKCRNIVCDDAITATVGSNKQLTMMILPSDSKTITVEFDASEFEMDGITIAMLKLSDGLFGSVVDDASAAMSSVSEGIAELLDGSGQLKNGADDLVNGVSLLNSGGQSIKNSMPALQSGMADISAGAWELDSGLSRLVAGSAAVRSGLMELDSKSPEIASGISAIEGGLSEMIKNKSKIQSGLSQLRKNKNSIGELAEAGETLTDGYRQVYDGIAQIAANKEQIQSGLDTLHSTSTDMSAMQSGLDDLSAGLDSMYSALEMQEQLLSQLYMMAAQNPELAGMAQYLGQANYIASGVKSGAVSAIDGVAQLKSGAIQAQDGINTLYSAADTFGNAALQMTDGAQTLMGATGELNEGLEEYTDGANAAGALYSSAETFGKSAFSLVEGAEKLFDGAKQLRDGFDAYSDGVGELSSSYIELNNGIYSAHQGASALYDGAAAAGSGIDSLYSVMSELIDNIDKLDSSTGALPSSVGQLKDGTQTLYDGVSVVDIASMIKQGSKLDAVSFTAPGAAKPDKVQFLAKTPNLHIPDKESPDTTEEKMSFWQKLISLFKKD